MGLYLVRKANTISMILCVINRGPAGYTSHIANGYRKLCWAITIFAFVAWLATKAIGGSVRALMCHRPVVKSWYFHIV